MKPLDPAFRDPRRKPPNKTPLTKLPMKLLLAKLQEPSTIRGLIALLGAFGITVQPEYHEHIIAAVLALIGIINVSRKEPIIPRAEVIEDEGGQP